MKSQRSTSINIFRISLALLLALSFAAPTQTARAASVLYAIPGASSTADCLSWANACTLDKALGEASSGDEIWVMQGTHKPHIFVAPETGRDATFNLKTGVAIYGGFDGTATSLSDRDWETKISIFSGDIGTANDNCVNCFHVVTGCCRLGVEHTCRPCSLSGCSKG